MISTTFSPRFLAIWNWPPAEERREYSALSRGCNPSGPARREDHLAASCLLPNPTPADRTDRSECYRHRDGESVVSHHRGNGSDRNDIGRKPVAGHGRSEPDRVSDTQPCSECTRRNA